MDELCYDMGAVKTRKRVPECDAEPVGSLYWSVHCSRNKLLFYVHDTAKHDEENILKFWKKVICTQVLWVNFCLFSIFEGLRRKCIILILCYSLVFLKFAAFRQVICMCYVVFLFPPSAVGGLTVHWIVADVLWQGLCLQVVVLLLWHEKETLCMYFSTRYTITFLLLSSVVVWISWPPLWQMPSTL
jgi:hypothetical protein